MLRKVSDTFCGPDDSDALLVHDGDERSVLDTRFLQNGTLYFYRAYYWNGSTWSASSSATGTPNATYEDASTDVLSIVRDRLDYGLQAEVASSRLVHDRGHIRVLTAPPVYQDTVWPVVTVQLQAESPSVRAVGETIEADELVVDDNAWDGAEGWLANVQLAVVGWSQNPDERVELRKALRRIIVANLPVFDDAGMVQAEFTQQDMEDFQSYPAPVYQTIGTLSCLAPVRVITSRDPVISNVEAEITVN